MYELALDTISTSLCVKETTITYADDGTATKTEAPIPFDKQRVNLAKWVICNIWGPTE